jgi:hypothetical protein
MEKNNKKIKIISLIIFSLVFLFSLSSGQSVKAQGASFYVLPSFAIYRAGEEFSLDIMIDVEGTHINAAQAIVYFPSQKLEVVGVSTNDSIFSLWIQGPDWSNEKGEIFFVGGLPSPGFMGQEGKVMTVTFKALSSGVSKVSFGQERVIANEPEGTDIFSFSQEARYPITSSKFEITVDNEGDPTNPRPVLYLNIVGDAPNINYYEVQVGEENFTLKEDEVTPWQLPVLNPGEHLILVKAVTKEGEVIESATEVLVESIPPPEVSFCPQTFISGQEVLYIDGTSLPDSSVLLFLKSNGDLITKWEVGSDSEGNWSLREETLLKPGVYRILAKTKDARGAISLASESCLINIILEGVAVGPLVLTYKSLAIFAIVILIFLLLWLFYSFLKIKGLQKSIVRETEDLKEKFYKEYNELKRDIEKEIQFLREAKAEGLTDEELRLERDLLKNLEDVERVLREELRDIEKIQ